MSTSVDGVKMEFPNPMSLRLGALYADMSEQRFRILVREGKIAAQQTESGQFVVTKEDIDSYIANRGSVRTANAGTRGQGKAWVIKVKAVDYAAVTEALAQFGIVLEPRYNPEAQARAQAKQKAKKHAAKQEELSL